MLSDIDYILYFCIFKEGLKILKIHLPTPLTIYQTLRMPFMVDYLLIMVGKCIYYFSYNYSEDKHSKIYYKLQVVVTGG